MSAEVIAELSHPQFPDADAALDLIRGVPLVRITDEVIGLAEVLVREKAMPGPARGDALHVAAAAVHGLDYLVRWNVRHLANRGKVIHLRTICLRAAFVPSTIVTPEFLWEEADESE